MKIGRITLSDLATSVLAVPPLARDAELKLNPLENQKLIRHVEAGDVTILLYGGNANLYHVPLSEYADLLALLAEAASPDTWVIPSAGPDFGRLMDQADILRQMSFPTTMVLPQAAVLTAQGTMTGLRKFAERLQQPIILYLKSDGYLSADEVQQLVEDEIVFAIKYAIVRDDPAHDPYLSELTERIDPRRIISGIGERPAIVHLQQFDLVTFTTGSGVIAPTASNLLRDALQAKAYERAHQIRNEFMPLEDCRDRIHPIRVLHDAVSLVDIAEMGPILPFLNNLEAPHRDNVRTAARSLLAYEQRVAGEAAIIQA